MNDSPPPPKLHWIALATMAAGVLTSVTNASMSSIVLPDLEQEFGVADDVLSWFVAAFLIPFAAGTMVYGRLADMKGTKRLLLIGVVLFCVSSFLVAASTTFELAVAARVFQGAGATAIPALSLATIARSTDDRGRGTAIGAIVIAVGVGFGIGPLLGGMLTEWIGWQGPFLATGIASALLFPLMIATIPSIPGTPGQRFDYIGAVLLTLAITGGIVAVNRLPVDTTDAYGLAGAITFVPLIALFALRTRLARQPFIDPALLRNGRFIALCIVGLCIQGAHFAVVVMLPLLLERYHGLDMISIGLHLLPGAVVLAISGVAAGALAARFGHRPLLVAGTWVLFNASVAFALAGAGWSPAGVAVLYAVVAVGYGATNAVVVHAATGELPPERTGIGVGVFNVAFFFGGALSVAALGAVLRLREDATSAWTGLFEGAPTEFSDAALVVVVLATVAFILAVGSGPGERAKADPVVSSATPRFHSRQKPNRGAGH